jgi:hypothetical protein
VQATRDELISEFERETRTIETLHTKEINRALQTQRSELNE